MTSESEWKFAYLVPHVAFREPIENDFLALVPYSDQRFSDLRTAHEAVRVLAENMTDAFGQSVSPSALLIHRDAPDSVDFYAVLSFRNIIAISSLVQCMALNISGKAGNYPLWSDYFDIYPFTADKSGKNLVAKSMALRSIEGTEEFSGQIAPQLPNNRLLRWRYDKFILQYLLAEWKAHFINTRSERRTRVLFRSLEVAAQASRMPATGTKVPTIHDVGVAIGLWVSSLEVLTHPTSGDANRDTVLKCLGKVDWEDGNLNAKRYSLKSRGGNVIGKINYCQKLYTELYQTRNDFMHGNNVTKNFLYPFKKSDLPLLTSCAVLVYHAAIQGFAVHKKTKLNCGKSPVELLQTGLEILLNSINYEDAMKKIWELSRK
tara:strand:+ start:10630 stop:11757 length:1128 start_codon:yes stop_codon:yes gene_type:complete